MAELEIRGSKRYIKQLKTHLEIEHPKTKGKMRIEGIDDGNKKKRK